jgi:hypothetical protein
MNQKNNVDDGLGLRYPRHCPASGPYQDTDEFSLNTKHSFLEDMERIAVMAPPAQQNIRFTEII